MLLYYFLEYDVSWLKLRSNLINEIDVEIRVLNFEDLFIAPVDKSL